MLWKWVAAPDEKNENCYQFMLTFENGSDRVGQTVRKGANMSIKEGTMVIVKNGAGEEVIGEVKIITKEPDFYMVKVPWGKGNGTEMIRVFVGGDQVIS